jgi:hypothetical protein
MFYYQNPTVKQMKEMIANGNKPMIFYHITKEEIVNKELKNIEKILNNLKLVGKGVRESLVLTVNGYDDVSDELYEIKEVREFVDLLLEKHPYIFYYTNSQFEADVWIICSYADEVKSVYMGEKYTGNELMEQFDVKDYHKIPKVYADIIFKNHKFTRVLRAVINHGKRNKDVKGAKRIAIQYAMRFTKTEQTLNDLGISYAEVIELMGGNS